MILLRNKFFIIFLKIILIKITLKKWKLLGLVEDDNFGIIYMGSDLEGRSYSWLQYLNILRHNIKFWHMMNNERNNEIWYVPLSVIF